MDLATDKFNLTKYIFRPINESDFKKWGMLLQYRDNGVLIREEYGVFHFGETMPVVGCHRWPTLPDVMTCNGIGGGSVNFAINLKALVFQIYYPGEYYLQSLGGDRFDTTSIEIGTCSPISWVHCVPTRGRRRICSKSYAKRITSIKQKVPKSHLNR